MRSAESSAQFGNAASLATFVTLANPPLDAHPVTVTSEQAVLSYDAAHPGQPLAARYPTGASAALGTPELDYPYVVTSTDPAEVTAAQEFGNLLRQGYTAALVRHYGFRSADGTTGTLPARRRAGPADPATGALPRRPARRRRRCRSGAGCRAARGTSR